MPDVPIRLVIRNYDSITPLIAGDVTAKGIELQLDRETPMAAFLKDESFQAGELSFAQYLRRLADGDREVTGLPIFVARGFRQRCFFVKNGSGLRSLEDLTGKRIGIDAWGATGHTWNRALLREAGVDITGIQWVIGPPEIATGQTATQPNLPPHASPAPEGKALVELLLSGNIDALIMSQPPHAFYERDSKIVRLFPNFREVEEEYAARVGYWPMFHILGLRTSVIEEHPQTVRNLFNAFTESQRLAAQQRLMLADSAPWLLEELESITNLLGPDWQAHGVKPNQAATATFCEEIYAQGIITTRIDPSRVFAEFERAIAAG